MMYCDVIHPRSRVILTFIRYQASSTTSPNLFRQFEHEVPRARKRDIPIFGDSGTRGSNFQSPNHSRSSPHLSAKGLILLGCSGCSWLGVDLQLPDRRASDGPHGRQIVSTAAAGERALGEGSDRIALGEGSQGIDPADAAQQQIRTGG